MIPASSTAFEKELLQDQQNEIDAHIIYKKLAQKTKRKQNKEILLSIASDEIKHYQQLKKYTKTELRPKKIKVYVYFFIARLLGFTFALKLLEKAEIKAQDTYKKISDSYPELKNITRDEEHHELYLIDMMHEDRLVYMSSIVLGLNDALVELTGALAGFTFALQNARVIAVLGLITGIAASLSMGASEYLSASHEKRKDAVKAAFFTATAYVCTVALLILPFLFFPDAFLSLIVSLGVALSVIAFFNYYISIAQDQSFKRRFTQMATISLGVASISFLIGVVVKTSLGAGI